MLYKYRVHTFLVAAAAGLSPLRRACSQYYTEHLLLIHHVLFNFLVSARAALVPVLMQLMLVLPPQSASSCTGCAAIVTPEPNPPIQIVVLLSTEICSLMCLYQQRISLVYGTVCVCVLVHAPCASRSLVPFHEINMSSRSWAGGRRDARFNSIGIGVGNARR